MERPRFCCGTHTGVSSLSQALTQERTVEGRLSLNYLRVQRKIKLPVDAADSAKQLWLCRRRPQGQSSFCRSSVDGLLMLTSGHQRVLSVFPGGPVPPSLGSRSRASAVSYFPTLHVYLEDLFDHGRFKSVWRLRPCSPLSMHTPWTLWLGGHENGLAYPKP